MGNAFMFQLTTEEVSILSRSKFLTSIMQTKGVKGGRAYLPYAFTEQGPEMKKIPQLSWRHKQKL
jgi:hypothetical protein